MYIYYIIICCICFAHSTLYAMMMLYYMLTKSVDPHGVNDNENEQRSFIKSRAQVSVVALARYPVMCAY